MVQRGARPTLRSCLLPLAAAALGGLACLGVWRAPGPGDPQLDAGAPAGELGVHPELARLPPRVEGGALAGARLPAADGADPRGGPAARLRAEVVNLSVERLAWLHIPKTGTSFVNVLVTWACPGLGDGEYFDGPPDLVWKRWIDKNREKCRPGLHLGCGHDEIHVSGRACNSWQRQKGSFVTFLRQPEQRLMSGFYNSKWGVKNKSLSLAEYVPLLASCQTRMFAGHRCESTKRVTDADVDLAIERLDTGFAFVGITEEWPLSVCLFHAMFGGSCHVRELWAWHSQLRPYNVSELDGFEDVYDGRIYAHGLGIFRKALKDYGVDQETCDARICRVPKCHLKSPPRQNMMVKCEPG
ncbi:unnamed protein product [Prorocentrum cordatum]|uniref:Sulfotransferase n=1 Tax=Prorocentrum cordatum TaxID=2364126 RepID=A0ABN9VEL4_9DINO|nr:unnamed protein product [Polarella glacialis]